MTFTTLRPAANRALPATVPATLRAFLCALRARLASSRMDSINQHGLPDRPRGPARPPLSSQDAATRLAIRAGVRPGNW